MSFWLELFAGGGGASCGLHAAGLTTMGIEWDEDAVAVAQAAGHDTLQGDVRDLEFITGELEQRLDPSDELHGIWSSFPCQDWSTAGKREGAQGERNGWPWTVAAIDHFKPRWFAGENVTGLLQHRGCAGSCKGVGDPTLCPKAYFDRVILAQLRERFAWVGYRVIDAASHGTPQFRRRVYIIAGPKPITWPSKTHGPPMEAANLDLFAPQLKPYTTVRQALNLDGTLESSRNTDANPNQERPSTTDEPRPAVGGKGNQYITTSSTGRQRIEYPLNERPDTVRGPSDLVRRHPIETPDLPASTVGSAPKFMLEGSLTMERGRSGPGGGTNSEAHSVDEPSVALISPEQEARIRRFEEQAGSSYRLDLDKPSRAVTARNAAGSTNDALAVPVGAGVVARFYERNSGQRGLTERRVDEPSPTVQAGSHGDNGLRIDEAGSRPELLDVRVLGGGTNPRAPGQEHTRTLRDITDEPRTTIAAQSGGGAGNAGPFVEPLYLHSERGEGQRERGGQRKGKSVDGPSPAIGAGSAGSGPRLIISPHEDSIVALERVRGGSQDRRLHPVDEPAPSITANASSGGQAGVVARVGGHRPELLDAPSAVVSCSDVKGTNAKVNGGWTASGGPQRASDTLWFGTGRRRLTPAECLALMNWPIRQCYRCYGEAHGSPLVSLLSGAPRSTERLLLFRLMLSCREGDADSGEGVRGVLDDIRPPAVQFGSDGGSRSLLEEALLRAVLLWEEQADEAGGRVVGGSSEGEGGPGFGPVREVWGEEGGDPSSERGHQRQPKGEPGAALSGVPSEGAPSSASVLWGALLCADRSRRWAGVLCEALSTVQEVGGPLAGEAQPTLSCSKCGRLSYALFDYPVGAARTKGSQYKIIGNGVVPKVAELLALAVLAQGSDE